MRLLTLIAIISTLIMSATAAYAAPPQKSKTESLLCLSRDKSVLVYFDAPHNELLVNGEPHQLITYTKQRDGQALHTADFENYYGVRSYIALVSVNHGAHRGMYLTLFNAATNYPDIVLGLSCHKFSGK